MKTAWKVLLGIASLVPLVFFGFFFFWLIPAFFVQTGGSEPSLFSQRFVAIIPMAIAAFVMLVFLLAVYAVHLYRRDDVPGNEKAGVLLTIFVTNGIVLPLVWWFYIWRESSFARRRVISR